MVLTYLVTYIITNAVNTGRDMSILYNKLTILSLILSILETFVMIFIINDDIGLHGGHISITNIAQIFYIFIYIICILILQLTSFYNKEHLKITEYSLIILFAITGAIFLISTSDFVSIFLSIELQSYGLYLLSSIYKDSESSTVGSILYFLIGSLSSCLLLLGISLCYRNGGATSLENLYIITSLTDIIGEWYNSLSVNISLLIFSIGLLFKLSAAPFHFWSPDVYDSIPTIVTTFVAILPKISLFLLLLSLIYYLNYHFVNSEMNWIFTLLLSSFLSLIIGTIVGLTQFRIKRLFAYSTISHVGFLLLSLSILSAESLQGFLFYLTQYSISNLNAFLILLAIGFYYAPNIESIIKDKINSPIQLISQLKGYFFINPHLSLSLAFTIFSFAGIPPLIGFFGKQIVLNAALSKGFIFLSFIIISTSVIGAVYYLSIVEYMFFYYHKLIYSIVPNVISFSIAVISLIILLFVLSNQEWMRMSTILVHSIL